MSAITELPAFEALVVFSVLLALKMGAVAFVTAKARFDSKVVLNPEDAPVNPGSLTQSEEAAGTLRAKRAHLNDVENIPVFMILALLLTLTGCSAMVGWLLRRLFHRPHAAHDLLSSCRSALANRGFWNRPTDATQHHGATVDACALSESASTVAWTQKEPQNQADQRQQQYH